MKLMNAMFSICCAACLLSARAAGPAEALVHTKGYADTQACEPVRPEGAEKNTKTRKVSFAFLIGPDGEIQQSKLTRSSGDKLLDQATLEAWQKCTFHPAAVAGHTQISWVMLSYKWKPA